MIRLLIRSLKILVYNFFIMNLARLISCQFFPSNYLEFRSIFSDLQHIYYR